MPESINLFNQGMNSDLSPVFQEKNSYVNAVNVELLSDTQQGSVAISNSKGNKLQQSLPNIGDIFKLGILDVGTSNITINGITSATSFTVTATTTYSDLYNFILNDTNFDLTTINLYYSYNKLVIVSTPPNTLTVTVSNSLVLSGGTTPFIPAQSNLQPIGYGIINDDIYIFSTSCTDKDPQVTGNGYGQIWKLTYDNIGYNPVLSTIELIYSANLAFSTYWNIPQTGVVSRYENAGIQKIYWTDYYNRIRNINVVDPMIFATDVSLLELIPSVDFDIPILTSIYAGGTASLKVGAYQIAYKLKNTTSSETTYSPLSNIVSVVAANEAIATIGTNNFSGYIGEPYNTTCSKIITWTVNNVDISYDRIEAVVLIRELEDQPPLIYSFFDDAISGRTSIDISFDADILNNQDTTELTLSEFITLSGYFTHAKTLSTKDNCLIAGNIRNASTDINFDARAFRAKSTLAEDIYLTNDGVQSLYDLTTAQALDETEDAINDYQNSNAGYYKPNSINLGGAGANISYEFVSVAVESDTGNGTTSGANLNIGAQQTAAQLPYRCTQYDVIPFTSTLNLNVNSVDEDDVDVLQEYPLTLPQYTYEDMKYPQYNALYWGYQQNEIYRMGIQFYDKAKNPYFVKWIGDIKFPDINDVCPAANNIYADGTPTGQLTFVKSFVAGRSGKPLTGYITQLGIKIDITIPTNLTDEISGYSIVRVKREESDKTVIAEGIITSVLDNASPNFYYTPDPAGGPFMDAAAYTLPEPAGCFFNTPNAIISGLTQPRTSDTLTVRKAFNLVNSGGAQTQLGGSGDPYYIYKLYTESATPIQTFTFREIFSLGIGEDVTVFNGYSLNNNDNNSNSLGNRCYYLDLNGVPLLYYGDPTYKLYATIDRVLVNQYGGATYANRSANEYILCSHFRPIATSLVDYNDSSLIFGGDVLNYHIDMQRAIKDWIGGGPTLVSTTFIFPAASHSNVGLRYGTFVNKNLITDDSAGASGTESYEYNKVFSSENDIIKFFPKPDPFISNTEFNNRFRISDIKINGELSDSWAIFRENNYWDVEGAYGPINSSLIMSDKLYFWQDRAFGIMQVNPRTVVQDINGTSLQVGTGLPLQRHDYISTTVGSKHQSSTISSDRKIYFYDTNTKKIYTFNSQEGLNPFSDVKGMYAYLSTNLNGEIQNIDKPLYTDSLLGVNGVSATYDFKRHKAIFTFHSAIQDRESPVQTAFTLGINELNDTFLGFYSFTPRIYINDYKSIFSNNEASNVTSKDLYLHDVGNYGQYYGVTYQSYIKFIVNEAGQFTKVFDNLVYDSQAKNGIININDNTWSSIRVTNDYQNSDTIPLVYNTNIKRKERSWQLAIPRNRVLYTSGNSPNIYTDISPTAKPFAERIRDKYLSIELTYDNTSNYQLLTNNVKTIFRQSIR